MDSAQRGFSLIELMITIIVLGVLATLAIPSMSQYMENSKIHATAEVFYSSVQQARTEAIRRNAPVEIIFTNQPPIAANVDTTGVTANGPNWLVRATSAVPDTAPTFVDGKIGSEAGGTVVIGSNATAIQFNATGALASPTTTAVVDFTTSRGTCETLGGTARCLRVTVSTGGQARLCDPVTTAANDTRKC
ncbi:GspH/FimT family pseudopilin [soil metagenome]